MKELIKKLLELYKKYKEIINYLVVGGCVTVVNFISYSIPAKIFGVNEVLSNVIAWCVSVIFAYVTNKIFVFESKTSGFKELFREMTSFILGRLGTGVLCDVGLFALMVEVLHINDILSKITTQVLVVILNYVLSKVIIFKNKGESEKDIAK